MTISQFSFGVLSAKIVGRLSYKMSNPVTRKAIQTSNNYFSTREKNETSFQYLIRNKDKNVFCFNHTDLNVKTLYLDNYDFIKNKKLITISPGGYRGFYMLGTCSFIKEKYNTSEYIFSGASAGAWNSLFMTIRCDSLGFVLKSLEEDIRNQYSIKDTQIKMKEKFLNYYTTDDFDLKRLFVGVTTIEGGKLRTNIFSDFDNLEDAINCCIASSHIPLVTGSLINKYNNQMTFDGGFSHYPYLNVKESILHISPNIWKKEVSKNKIKNKLMNH
jgi:hypothetical protein